MMIKNFRLPSNREHFTVGCGSPSTWDADGDPPPTVNYVWFEGSLNDDDDDDDDDDGRPEG